jgi:hypothetical protein
LLLQLLHADQVAAGHPVCKRHMVITTPSGRYWRLGGGVWGGSVSDQPGYLGPPGSHCTTDVHRNHVETLSGRTWMASEGYVICIHVQKPCSAKCVGNGKCLPPRKTCLLAQHEHQELPNSCFERHQCASLPRVSLWTSAFAFVLLICVHHGAIRLPSYGAAAAARHRGSTTQCCPACPVKARG